MSQKQYTSHYQDLKNKWTDKQREIQKSLLEKHEDAFTWLHQHAKHIAVGTTLTAFLFSAQPVQSFDLTNNANETYQQSTFDKRMALTADLMHILPDTVQPLSDSEEKVIEQTLFRHYGIPVRAELENKRLNRSYGIIGAEQHLARYPGDTMASHFDTAEESNLYYSSGMAPGLGAWRYFAPSQSEMTEEQKNMEKYYIAVQTFLAPGYNENVREYSNFFKFRKMLVVNPQNGKAVVAVIGDAGPGVSTGKHLGGSPEVMSHLKRVDGKQRGPVLYFFIDDPDNTIPLGPVSPK